VFDVFGILPVAAELGSRIQIPTLSWFCIADESDLYFK